MISLSPMWLALVPAALAQASAEDHLAQAQLFVRKRWFHDADDELRAGLALPAGQDSYALHWLAAQVAWELLDVERAMKMAQDAADLAPDEARCQAATALVDSYRTGFGFLDVRAPQPGVVSRLQVEPQGPIFDPELKRYVNRKSLELRGRTSLPVRFGLPIGPYLINGREVVVEAGQTVPINLNMRDLGQSGLAALQVSRLELAPGVGMLAGTGVHNLRPAPLAQIGWTQPLGFVLVGLLFEGHLDGYQASHGHTVSGVPTWAVGLRLGHEFVLWGPLTLRTSLQYRVGYVPGLPLACDPDGTSLSCVATDAPADLDAASQAIFVTSLAHRPGIELSLDYREAGRTTAVGTGVKLVVDQAIGRLPTSGLAEPQLGAQPSVTWHAPAHTWTATGVQMLGTLSFAF